MAYRISIQLDYMVYASHAVVLNQMFLNTQQQLSPVIMVPSV